MDRPLQQTAAYWREECLKADDMVALLEARIKKMEMALGWIRTKASDRKNPAISFVADKALRGEDFSPLRETE